MSLDLTEQQRALAAFVRHRAGVPLTPEEQAQYGEALEDCEQMMDGTCDLEGTDACDRRCPFRWLD